jgi:sensor histidine kinase YesM
MEFDNDRIIKRANRIELLYFGLLIFIHPLVNAVTFFFTDIYMWPVLLGISLAVFPFYVLYSKLIVTRFLFPPRHVNILPVIIFFLVVLGLLYLLYSLVLTFPLAGIEKLYFIFDVKTIARESTWIIVNMTIGTAIPFIKEALDEKDMIALLQKDNTFYKLRYLRAQLNPHFLFNTLNSIYSLSLQKSDKTPDVVVRLADIMRYLIYECNEEKIPLNKEIDFIRNYIEIEKIRYSADIRFDVEGETDDIMIEPFLFISFIENGFKHAFDNAFAEPFIYIMIKVSADRIVLNVINNSNTDLELQAKRINGKGISNSKSLLELLYPDLYDLEIIQTEKEEKRENSLRIRNARERLEVLYPDSHTLDVILNNNTFTVSLTIKSRAA